LADVYYIVTTTAYLPKDSMALTLDGTPKWPDVRQLTKLGSLRCGLSLKEISAILDRVAGAVSEALVELQRYARHDPSFADIAARMEGHWGTGLSQSLGCGTP
jgi:serine/threonine-protein kinase HipA